MMVDPASSSQDTPIDPPVGAGTVDHLGSRSSFLLSFHRTNLVIKYAIFLALQGTLSLIALIAIAGKLDTFTTTSTGLSLVLFGTLLRLREARWYPRIAAPPATRRSFRLPDAIITIAIASCLYTFGILVYFGIDGSFAKLLSVDALKFAGTLFSLLLFVSFGALVLVPSAAQAAFGPVSHGLFFFSIQRATNTSRLESSEDLELRALVQQVQAVVKNLSEGRALAYADLRTRGQRLKSLNVSLLLLIVAVLVAAAGFIVFAGQIAGRDTQSLDSVRTLRLSIEATTEQLAKQEQQREEQELISAKALRQLADKAINESKRQELQEAVDQAKLRRETLSTRISRLTADLDRQKKMADELESSLYSSKSDARDPVTATNLLVAAGITRFGVLAVVIYLVQILVGLYRYNAQLAGHYFALADALLLSGSSSKEIGLLSTQLQPHVSFGKPVATLPEKVIDKMAEAIKFTLERAGTKKSEA